MQKNIELNTDCHRSAHPTSRGIHRIIYRPPPPTPVHQQHHHQINTNHELSLALLNRPRTV